MNPSLEPIVLVPIGIVRSTRVEIADDDWGDVVSTIELDARFDDRALLGLETFSHVEVIFLMNLIDPSSVEMAARHPRGRADWPVVGVFAQRAKWRPNRLGASLCRIVSVEGRSVTVVGLDALDGSPVLDIKPYMREFGPRGNVDQPQWATELMAKYY